MFFNIYRQLFSDPTSALVRELRLMFGREDISQEKYIQLKEMALRGQLGRGDLAILRRGVYRERNGPDNNRHVRQKVSRKVEELHLEKTYLLDAKLEAEDQLNHLEQLLLIVREQAEKAGEAARQAISDEDNARKFLVEKYHYLKLAKRIQLYLDWLHRCIRRSEQLSTNVDIYTSELLLHESMERIDLFQKRNI
jgi:hypothetical protein